MAEPNFFDQFDRAPTQSLQVKPADRKLPGELTLQGQSITKNQQDIAKGPGEIREQGLRIQKLEDEIANPEKQASEGERKAAAFVRRAIGGFRDYEATGLGPRSFVGEFVNEISPDALNKLPDDIGNSPARVNADRAQREFIGGILRYDSGATIPPEEIETQGRIYFPRAGQVSPEELEGYRQARIRGIESLISSAGRALTPDLQAEVDAWRASLAGEQAIAQPDEAPAQLATGDTKTEAVPGREGVNAFVGSALKNGASNREILAALKQRGFSNEALLDIAGQLARVAKFRKENPGYKGDFKIDLERRQAPTTLGNKIAASGPGALGIAMGDTFTGGHLDNLIGMTGGDAEEANAMMQAAREANPGFSLAGDALGGASLYLSGAGALRAAGMAPQAGRVAAMSPRALAGDAALGGYVSSGQGGTQIADPGQMIAGAGLGAGTGLVTRGTLNTVGAAVSPTGGKLAPIYEAGGKPTVGQRLQASDNALLRKIGATEEIFSRFPILGAAQRSGRNAAMDEMQRGAFNEALGEIGTKLPKGIKKGAQAHSFMQREFDHVYDRARSGMQFAPDGQWSADLGALQQDVALLSKDSQNTFRNLVNVVGGKLRASGGTLNGDQYKLVVSRLGKKIAALRSNPNGDTELADALESFKTAIDDAARRQSNPNAVALLDKADRGYAKAVVIENAAKARGGSSGEFNGNQLDAAVQRTDKSRRSRAYLRGEANMQRYGEAAKALGDFVPNSGTPEQLATLTAGGLAAGVSPGILAPWAITGAPALPGVRQVLGAAMGPRPQSIRPVTDQARGILELLGRYGAPATSVPVVTE